MSRFPTKIRDYKIMKHGVTSDHIFCANCGRELTKFNFKNGQLVQKRHYLCTSVEGFELRYCWRRDICEKRRKQKRQEGDTDGS